METTKKHYSYGEIVAVGRKLRRTESILNNAEQFKEAFFFEFHEYTMMEHFDKIIEFLTKRVAISNAIYNNMLSSLNS